MTTICEYAFSKCEALKKISFQEGIRLNRIGKRCFLASGIETVTIQRTTKVIEADVFQECRHLRTICMEDGCECSLSDAGIPDSTRVILQHETAIGNRPVLELWKLREVVIPDGVECVGNYWFWGSGVEKVTVSAGVKVIGIEAFCNCRKLRKLVFRKTFDKWMKSSSAA